MPRGALLLVATLGLIAAGPSSVCARLVAGDAFLCAAARAVRTPRGAPSMPVFRPRVAVSAIDRFTLPRASERYTIDLEKAEALCRPVRLDGEDVTDPLSGLEAYDARRTRRKPSPPPLPATTEVIETSLGTVTTLELTVGAAFALTTVGAGPVNVTQEAFYTSSDSTVVVATNQSGSKSRIEAIAPGVVTITAFRASTYPQATDSNAITVTLSAP